MTNPYVNKVELSDGTTIMDLTSDTVTAGDMVRGVTAHDRSGAAITGSLGNATQSTDGLMSASDKEKLDGFTGPYCPEAGRILPYGGTTPPEGYLMCDGEAYSREEYSELFEVIGTTFGSGDGSTTFNVPDLRGRTSIGANASHLMGTTGGEESHTLTVDEMPSHYHAGTTAGYSGNPPATGSGTYSYPSTVCYQERNPSDRRSTASAGGGQAHNNMQPYQVVNYIICTGKVGYAGIKGDKGDKGDTGSTGAAAGFGTPTATVDSNTGTPSVTVTASGPDTAKVFEFEFENIKGDKGEPLEVDHFVPVAAGLIYPYAGSTAPTGYLMCDGSAVSRITYADLFEAIGTTYGAGDGSTTFNVPDLRGRIPLGSSSDYALGSTGGAAEVTLTKEQSGLPSHGHGFTQPTVNGGKTTTGGGGAHGHQHRGYYNTSWDGTVGRQCMSRYYQNDEATDSSGVIISVSNHTHEQVAHTHSVSGGAVSNNNGANASQAHTNLQPYTATNYIISTGFEYGGLQGTAAGFGTPTATIDSNVGTPSVTVTATGPDTAKIFEFEFENMKGETGAQGTAAGFGTPTATVDNHSGTPSVTVTATGPDTAKVFDFEFSNLKGEPFTIEDTVEISAGIIHPFAGSVAPDGYLMCDGAAVSRTEYAELFIAIGTTYGAGDGSTTFNVPDLRAKVPIGSNTSYALGATGGEAEHVLLESEMPSHVHEAAFDWASGGGSSKTQGEPWAINMTSGAGDGVGTWPFGSDTGATRFGWTGGSQAHNNMQPYQVVNYIICTGKKFPALKGETGDVGNVIHIGTSAPNPRGSYVLWYNPLSGAFKAWNYVTPDDYTNGDWAWRELSFADIGKNGDIYTATADVPQYEEAVPVSN